MYDVTRLYWVASPSVIQAPFKLGEMIPNYRNNIKTPLHLCVRRVESFDMITHEHIQFNGYNDDGVIELILTYKEAKRILKIREL